MSGRRESPLSQIANKCFKRVRGGSDRTIDRAIQNEMKASNKADRNMMESQRRATPDGKDAFVVLEPTEVSSQPTPMTGIKAYTLPNSNDSIVTTPDSSRPQQSSMDANKRGGIDMKDGESHSQAKEQAYKLDKDTGVQERKVAETGKDAKEVEWDEEDSHLIPFREVLNTIDLGKLKNFALSLRKDQFPDVKQPLDCEVCTRPKNGSYNLVYIITFSDGLQWCARIPGYGKQPTRHLREKMDIEYNTMKYIRKWTSFPVPTVHYWTTGTTEIGVAFALISFMPGRPLTELWFERESFGEEKRLATLSSIAEQMKKLYLLQFPKTGMLRCGSDENKWPEVGHALDYHDDGRCLWSGVIKRGQNASFDEWLEDSAKRLEKYDPNDGEMRSPHGALRMLTSSVPKHMRHVPLTLSLADLDLQNVFVDPVSGEVTGFIDFDGVAVQPAHIGAAAHPLWLTRNFNPMEYVYAPGMLYEDSPEDLARYRKYYADCWEEFDISHLGLMYDPRWTRQSHAMKTIWSAIVAHHHREGMTYMLIDHAYANAFNLGTEELAQLWDSDWDNYEPWKLELAIMKGLWSQRAGRVLIVVTAREVYGKVSSALLETRKYLGVISYMVFGVQLNRCRRRWR